MRKQAIEFVLGKKVEAGAPAFLGRGFTFEPGHSFHTRAWFYPGEPYEEGSIGQRLGHVNDKWSFWTGFDIDGALIFDVEEIREVIIPNDAATVEIFTGAPFKVTIKP